MKTGRFQLLTLFIILGFFLLPACTRSAPNSALPTLTPTSAMPLPPVITATPFPTISPDERPNSAFDATVTVEGLNLRENPGYLFPVLYLLTQDETVTVLGMAPGGEWVNVEYEDGTRGWVFGEMLSSSRSLTELPIVQPADVVTVTGQVVDIIGNPISGIGYTFIQGDLENGIQNPATSDANGYFYAYLPADSGGEWRVVFTAVSCTSNTMDANCSCTTDPCGTSYPEEVTITLPDTNTVTFIWK